MRTTVSMEAVEVNGSPPPVANSIDVVPGDIIRVEIFASDWTTTNEELLGFQTSVRRDAFTSGTRGNVLPLGWDRPILPADEISCIISAPDCPAEYPVCQPAFKDVGICVGTDHDLSDSVFVGLDNVPPTRDDWAFLNGKPNRHHGGIVCPYS